MRQTIMYSSIALLILLSIPLKGALGVPNQWLAAHPLPAFFIGWGLFLVAFVCAWANFQDGINPSANS